MAKAQSTAGAVLHTPVLEFVTIYDAQGNSISCAPVDARESVATGRYFYEKPEPVKLGKKTGEDIVNAAFSQVKANEQSRQQQPIHDDVVSPPMGEEKIEEKADAKAETEITGQFPRRGRPPKAIA